MFLIVKSLLTQSTIKTKFNLKPGQALSIMYTLSIEFNADNKNNCKVNSVWKQLDRL